MRGISGIVYFSIFCILCILLAIPTKGISIIFLAIYCYFVFWGSEKRKINLIKKIEANFTSDEKIIIEAVEMRSHAFFHRRFGIAVTNNRIVMMQRNILGGHKPIEEWQWKYINEIKVSENNFPNLLGSNLNFTFRDSPNHSPACNLVGIDSATAAKIGSIATAQKQDWSEKHRIRGMEEARARAGGINIQGMSSPAQSNVGSDAGSITEKKLMEAKRLLENGAISDSEFQEIKSKIISSSFG